MPRRITPFVLAMSLVGVTPLFAAIGVDVSKSTDRTTAATTVTSPAFSTASANELLLAFVATDGALGTTATVTSVTGAGLTWALVARANAQPGTSEIWRAFATSTISNVTVTATISQSVVSTITVMSFTGVDTSGTNGSGAVGATKTASAPTGAPAASLVTTRANSLVVGVGNDWDQAIARTAASGQSVVHQSLSSSGDTYWIQSQNASTPASGTSVSINDTAPATDRYNLAICEVLTGGGGPAGSISGTITPTTIGNGTTVTLTGVATGTRTADANGSFGFSALPDGGYTVTPSKTGYTFTPPSQAVTISGGNSATVSFAGQGTGPNLGTWDPPFELGIVAVNAVMMHTGKVLMFSGTFASSWVERVWDPATGAITLVPNPYYDLFCAGQTQLADGRILVVGGYDPSSTGTAHANIFDPVTQSWSALPDMAYRRWYPTATALPDGRALVTSGAQTCLTCLADVPEIFDPATDQFSTLPSARLAVPYYPFMFVLPDGSIVDAGANEDPVATNSLNVSNWKWSMVDSVVRDGHSAAMYLPGKILKTGTAADSGTAGNAKSTAFVLDMTQPSPAWHQVASMAFPRAYQNTTLLPDGTVLVTGGGTTLDGHDTSKAVLAAELWSPATQQWQTLASATVPRLYHSTALLMPDGRVLTAGGGNDNGAVNETQGEIFSPPYLFKGARPTIASVPGNLQYGASFSVTTPDAATIASVVLIRPAAVTHAFDENQRFVPLSFTPQGGALTVQAPANANLAPPGYYMLFIVNANGVPSVAPFVNLPIPGTDTLPPTPPGALTAQGAIGSAALTWTASSDNTGVALYTVYRSTTSGFQPSAANRIGQSANTTYTDAGIAAGTYFYLVTAQDVAGNVSGPSNEATAIVLADTTPPVVAITTPGDQTTVSGTTTIAATASDDVGVAGVQFEIDGAPFGAERTGTPYSIAWNTATTSNATHTVTAIARDAAGNRSSSTVTVTVFNNSPAPPGLVAAYGFNEGTGVQTTDASGQGNTGTLSNATWAPAGKFGSALSFNGTNAWVTIADAASLHLTTGMTIEAWINPSSGTGWRAVVLKETTDGLAYALYSADNASHPAGYIHTNMDVAVTGTSAITLNTWTHVAVTYDGAVFQMYVNGVPVSTTSISGSITSVGGVLRIGGDSIWGEYFRGLIDEVRVYNRVLSAAEIQTDMTTPIQ